MNIHKKVDVTFFPQMAPSLINPEGYGFGQPYPLSLECLYAFWVTEENNSSYLHNTIRLSDRGIWVIQFVSLFLHTFFKEIIRTKKYIANVAIATIEKAQGRAVLWYREAAASGGTRKGAA
jgi:hypothetical protein